MHAVRTLVALSLATLATACASPGSSDAAPPSAGMAPMSMGAPGSTAAMEPRMQAMRGGVAMMKEQHALHAGGKGDMGMPADMAKRHQMMTDHIAMMQMMMDMMADRMPPAAASQ